RLPRHDRAGGEQRERTAEEKPQPLRVGAEGVDRDEPGGRGGGEKKRPEDSKLGPPRGSPAREQLRRASHQRSIRSPITRATSSSAPPASSHATIPSGIGPMLPRPQPPRPSGCWTTGWR